MIETTIIHDTIDQNYAKMLLTLHKNSKHNRAGRMLIIVFGELKQLRIQMSNGNNFEFWRTGNTIGYYSFNNFQDNKIPRRTNDGTVTTGY